MMIRSSLSIVSFRNVAAAARRGHPPLKRARPHWHASRNRGFAVNRDASVIDSAGSLPRRKGLDRNRDYTKRDSSTTCACPSCRPSKSRPCACGSRSSAGSPASGSGRGRPRRGPSRADRNKTRSPARTWNSRTSPSSSRGCRRIFGWTRLLLHGLLLLGDARGVVGGRREADGLPDGLDFRRGDLEIHINERDVDLKFREEAAEEFEALPLLRGLVHLESQPIIVHVLLHRRLAHALLDGALLLLGHALLRPLPAKIKRRALEQAEVLHLQGGRRRRPSRRGREPVARGREGGRAYGFCCDEWAGMQGGEGSRDGGVRCCVFGRRPMSNKCSPVRCGAFELPRWHAVMSVSLAAALLPAGAGNGQRTAKDLDLNGEQLSRSDALQIASCFHRPRIALVGSLT